MSGVKGMKRQKRAVTSPAYAEALRTKIAAGMIVNALQQHVEGKREMSATQVTAGLGLLRKVCPDLSAVEHSGNKENPIFIANAQQLMESLRQ